MACALSVCYALFSVLKPNNRIAQSNYNGARILVYFGRNGLADKLALKVSPNRYVM